MKFESMISTKQYYSIVFLIIGILLLSVELQNSLYVLRIVALTIIIFSVLAFWEESARRYKILTPYKQNNYDSKAERKIADYFKRKNIIFYHNSEIKVPKPFWIFSIPFVNLKLKPDFFLPEFNAYVEYWGLIDDPEYKKNSYDFKKKLYMDNNLSLVSLYPKNIENLDWVFTLKLLDVIKKREGNRRYR